MFFYVFRIKTMILIAIFFLNVQVTNTGLDQNVTVAKRAIVNVIGLGVINVFA